MNVSRALPGLLVAIAVVLAACSSSTQSASAPSAPPASTSGGQARTSEGGQVTVVASWGGPTAGAIFDVKLDTHSVDLDALDLANATLRNDRDETLSAPQWTASKGGHHREGSLTFDGNAPAFFAGASWIELMITGVGDLPERTLRWEVGS